MTVSTKYYNFQRNDGRDPAVAYPRWDAKGWNKRQPAAEELLDFMCKRWGGHSLGMFGRRPIKGSGLDNPPPSSHGTGGTFDWSYKEQGAPEPPWLDECFDFLIDNSLELGVQFIGHYYGCRIWKADRSGDANGGWKTQTPSKAGMGQKWAAWVHLELHPDEFLDAREVMDKIGLPPATPVFDPEDGLYSLWPFATNKPVMRKGSKGDAVRYLQGVMRNEASQTWLRADGQFGSITRQSVLNVQRMAGIKVDGVVGPQTWRIIDKLAVG